jgi:2-polyprenyl-3-methyl-5-hydroxy-6-metoxy-1,4-benzoquinol methylase
MIDFSKYKFEETTCPLCGPDAKQNLRYDFSPFRVIRCAECGLDFLSPRFTEKDILEFYQGEDYYTPSHARQGYDDYLDLRNAWVKTFRRRLKDISAYKKEGRILDIGCGPGFFLEAAQEMGYIDLWGIDPSDFIVGVAREKFGEKILLGTIESEELEPESFDMLTAFDVFEHIYRPVDFVNRAYELLREDGVLAFTTPNPRSVLAYIFGKQWVSFKLPEHVFYWSPKTVRKVLEDKFEIIEIRHAGQYATASFLFRRLFQINSDARGILRAFLDFLTKINLYADNGSITVVARKK